jgi:hypothetical protein
MTIVEGVKKPDEAYWDGGEILDPTTARLRCA